MAGEATAAPQIMKIGVAEFGFGTNTLEHVLSYDVSICTRKQGKLERRTGHDGKPVLARHKGELEYDGDIKLVLGGKPGEEQQKSLEALLEAWKENRLNTKLEAQVVKLTIFLKDTAQKKILSVVIPVTVERFNRINLPKYKGFTTYVVELKAVDKAPPKLS